MNNDFDDEVYSKTEDVYRQFDSIIQHFVGPTQTYSVLKLIDQYPILDLHIDVHDGIYGFVEKK